MLLNFSSSERLLLCCTRSRFDDEARRQILNLLKEKIDWEGFITQARHHGTAASTYLHFKQLDEGIPEEVKNKLRKMYLWNVIHNLKLTRELEEVQEKVFQPLFTTRARGIGLGLAITKGLIEANQGKIEVASREREGAFAILTKPLNIDELLSLLK